MAHAGLTRGAFYSYFESKSDLYADVLGFFTDPNWKSRFLDQRSEVTSFIAVCTAVVTREAGASAAAAAYVAWTS